MATPTNKNVLKDREKYLGGSEISTILGINKFQTRFDLLMIKAGWKQAEIVDNPYVNFGSEMEKYIRDYVNKEYCYNLEESTIIEDTGHRLKLRCNYDGLDENKRTGFEAKTTSQIHENVRDYKYYVCQLLYGMIIGNLDYGVLAVYKRNEDFKVEFEQERLQVFIIKKEDFLDWIEEINFEIERFFEDLEKVIQNPLITEYELRPQLPVEVINIMSSIELLNNEYIEAKKVVEQFENFKKELFVSMEKYNIKKWDTEKGLKFTRVDSTQDKITKVFDEETFKKENTELYEKYLKDKTVRGKKGYIKVC